MYLTLEIPTMSNTTMVHMRVDEKIKTRASRALSATGPSISDAVRVLLTRVAAEQRLTLESKIPNVETRAAMSETDEILRGRRAVSGKPAAYFPLARSG